MTQTEIAIQMVLDRWNGSIANWNKILNELSDEQLRREIAPGRNTGTYLLGHLIAVHDEMLKLLDMGEKLYPELFEPFIKDPDQAMTRRPSAAALRIMWATHCTAMQEKFAATTSNDWFSKHTAVSEEDFRKEPHRNKLNIIITRTSHLQYHSGQLVLLKNQIGMDNQKNFQFSFTTSTDAGEVFAHLLDPTNWWVGLFNETIEGASAAIHDEFSFSAGDGAHYSRQKLTEIVPGQKITWLVTESKLSFLKHTNEWAGTRIGFDIARVGNNTHVRFTHEGLVPSIECYGGCSGAWTQYLQNLADYFQSRR